MAEDEAIHPPVSSNSDGSHFLFSTSRAEPIVLAVDTFAIKELKCCKGNRVLDDVSKKPLEIYFYLQSCETKLEKGITDILLS